MSKKDFQEPFFKGALDKVLLGVKGNRGRTEKMTANLGLLNQKLKSKKIPLDQVDEPTKIQLFKNLLLDPKDQVELDWGTTADGKPLPKLKGAI